MSTRNYRALTSADQVGAIVDKLLESDKDFAFDIESGYHGPYQKDGATLTHLPGWFMVGISFTNSNNWAVYVPIAHDVGQNVDNPVEAARHIYRLLMSGKGVPHNGMFELGGVSRWFRETLGRDPELGEKIMSTLGRFPMKSDTMLEVFVAAKYAPTNAGGPGLGLKPLVKHIFGHEMTELKDLFRVEGKKSVKVDIRFNTLAIEPKVIDYACEDSAWTMALHEMHYEEVKDSLIFKTEMGLIPVMTEMEDEALFLDWARVTNKAAELEHFKNLMNEEILAALSDRLGEVININLGSAQQLATVLFDKLGLPIKKRSEKTGAPSTANKVMESIAKEDSAVRSVLQYREVNKLLGSYLKKYRDELNYAGDGRAYPSHKQTGALTGRFSVSGVSYQQWPKPYHYKLSNGATFDFNFRDLLISPEDFRIIGYDFSQVELRVLAGQAQEDSLLKAFADGIDIHKATAANMFNIPLEEVTKAVRAQGKTLNFAVVYGSGAANIAEMLTKPEAPVTTEDAQKLLDAYFAAFPKLKKWMDARVVEGREQGFVNTLFGRKFTVWEYTAKNGYIRSKGDRMCVNAPIQGGAADYMKIGMVRVSKAIKKAEAEGRIPKGGIRLFMTIHDALEFYVHKDVETQTVIDIVQPCVTFPFPGLPDIRADWHEGYKWGSVVEIKLDENKQISHYALDDVDQKFPAIEYAYAYLASQNLVIEKVSEKAQIEAQLDGEDVAWTTSDGVEIDAESSLRPAYFEPDMQAIVDRVESVTDEVIEAFEEDTDTKSDPEAEPEWLHGKEWHAEVSAPQVIITMLSDPTTESWPKFESWLAKRPGTSALVVEMPEGEITMDGTYELHASDQPELSLMLNGAEVRFITVEQDLASLTEGIEL